ncbi:hypothetical protein J6590_064193 [Homalodisca vitripennis]|nr:hypothetical protein J6590_064193 [Homalodisca vitripennis]
MLQPTSLDRHHHFPTQQPDILTTVTVSCLQLSENRDPDVLVLLFRYRCNVELVFSLQRPAAVLERRVLSTQVLQLRSCYELPYNTNFRFRGLSWTFILRIVRRRL